MSQTPVAGIEDRAPGERASSQGRATIQPLDMKEAAQAFAELVTEIDPGAGRPVAESAAESAAPTSAPPTAAEIPELEEVRRAHERAEPAPAPGTDAARTSRPAVDSRQQARAAREARLQEAYERTQRTGRLRDAGDTFAALLIEKPE